MLVYWLILVISVGFTVWLVRKLIRASYEFWLTLQGPFFHPTSEKRMNDLLEIIELKPNDVVIDLGSGDGRVLIELVKKFPKIKAIGYEIDPKFVKISKEKIKAAGLLDKQIEIRDQSFWEADLNEADVLVVYCIEKFMKKLEQQLALQLKKVTPIYSVYFRFPNWQPIKTKGDIKLYSNPGH